MARSRDLTLRLYLTKWTNPWPKKEVASIDFVSTNAIAAPFCVAIDRGGAGRCQGSPRALCSGSKKLTAGRAMAPRLGRTAG